MEDSIFHEFFARSLVVRQDIQGNDSNIGSASSQSSSSVSAFLSSLVINGLIFLAMLAAFVILRKSQRRQYAPRTYIGSLPQDKRVEDLPQGMFAWIRPLIAVPEPYLLGKTSLDSYFFLRYLKVAISITFVGCCVTMPVLFPVNATGKGGQSGLDTISFSNIGPGEKNRYWAHALMAWVFFPFVMFTIYRELMHYIAVRHSYMCSPIYANRISARTILITSIPDEYLNVPSLLKIFDNVARIWINTDFKELDETVTERDKLGLKLEGAEVKLIRTADKNRKAAIKKGTATAEDAEQQGGAGAKWVPTKQRPSHKLKFLIGKKVDTIEWSRTELQRLNAKVKELQARQRTDQVTQLNSAFIEFTTQTAAQTAFQCLAHNRPLHMAPRFIGINPDEVVWSNLRLKWWMRSLRNAAVIAIIALTIIFWSIPVAIVGIISNVKYLTNKVHFLSFINDVPTVILGVITGFLPAILLAVLMALLPIFLRAMAKVAGRPSLSAIELHVQNSYFSFQVIQVFLVTTLSSAASAAVTQIIQNPTSVTSLLASSIPKASNFYISYMLLQGLSVSAGVVLQIVGLVIAKLLGKFLDGTPRKKWNRWTRLSGLGWGTVFPVYTNITVIAITYSIIAPLVLLFATIAISLFFLAFKYNILFVYDNKIDTKGLVYPRALYQTMTGVYLAEICLIGLFGIRAAAGPLIITVILLVITVLFHISLTSALGPLIAYLPRNVQEEETGLLANEEGAHAHAAAAPKLATQEGEAVGAIDSNHEVSEVAEKDGYVEEPPTANFLVRFLKPHIYSSYANARRMLPRSHIEVNYTAEERENAYVHPALASTEPVLWIARDEAGVSKEEIESNKGFNITSTDEFAWIDEKSKVQWEEMVDGEQVNPPDYTAKPYW